MLGQLTEAATTFEQAVKLQPNNPVPRYNLGNVYLKLQRVDAAIVQLSKAVELRPDYAAAYCDLGNALLRKGKPPWLLAG
jgi:predicted Zn-dependent protease